MLSKEQIKYLLRFLDGECLNKNECLNKKQISHTNRKTQKFLSINIEQDKVPVITCENNKVLNPNLDIKKEKEDKD